MNTRALILLPLLSLLTACAREREPSPPFIQPPATSPATPSPAVTSPQPPGNSSTPAEPLAGVEFLDAYTKRIAQTYCALSFHCPQAEPELGFYFGAAQTQQECVEFFSLELGTQEEDASLWRAIERGSIVVQPELARRCIDALDRALEDAEPCRPAQQLELNGSICELALRGQLGEGEPCEEGDECKLGGSCSQREEECSGTCSFGDGYSCPDVSCGEVAYCDFSGPEHKCVLRKTPGQPCESHEECEVGSYCDLAIADDVVGACAFYFSKNAGEACTSHRACDVGRGFFCDPEESVCTDILEPETYPALPRSEAGGPCDYASTLCAQGLVCMGFDFGGELGSCAAPLSEGEFCGSDAECSLGLTCIETLHTPDTYTCQRFGELGAACEYNFACESGRCDEGVCGELMGCGF